MKINFWWFLLSYDQVNASPFTKIFSWFNFLGKKSTFDWLCNRVRQKWGNTKYSKYVYKSLFTAGNSKFNFQTVLLSEKNSFVYIPFFCRVMYQIINVENKGSFSKSIIFEILMDNFPEIVLNIQISLLLQINILQFFLK